MIPNKHRKNEVNHFSLFPLGQRRPRKIGCSFSIKINRIEVVPQKK